MKWINAAASFTLVAVGVFFILGWCLLPPVEREKPELSETSRLQRFELLAKMDWGHNYWGFVAGPACGALSAGLTIRRAGRKSVA
jgi:hypothetical protein